MIRSKIKLLIPFVAAFSCALSQEIDLKKLSYVGYANGKLYFFKYRNRDDSRLAYLQYDLNDNTFSSVGLAGDPRFIPLYKDQEIDITRPIGDFSTINIVKGGLEASYTFDVPRVFGNFSVALLESRDTMFVSAGPSSAIFLLNKKSLELRPLPLRGGNLRIRGPYLLFESLCYSDSYSDYPKNIYRVHMQDLKNPEKVIIQVEGNWYPFSEDVIYAQTYPSIGDCSSKQCNGAIYDLASHKFTIRNEIFLTDHLVELPGGSVILNVINQNGRDIIQLNDVAQPSSSFPYEIQKDVSQIPRGNILRYENIPLKQKTFDDTFITHELLYTASKTELERLTKVQLKILRNSFYALQGYKFESRELVEFFQKFGWYNKLTMGKKDNNDVYLWPDELERVQLIREIENQN